MTGTVILPELWRTDPARGPDDAWWAQNALGLQRVWPKCREVVETVSRKWGLSPWLVLAKIESEQGGLSYAWDGTYDTQYKVLGNLRPWARELLKAQGVTPRNAQDGWKLTFLLGVDKPRASTKDDIGARPDGWFGPLLQVEGCCMRFVALYDNEFAEPDLVEKIANDGLPQLPAALRGYGFQADLSPGKPCTRGGVTITPANWMSCYSLAYMMSMPGQLKLREIGLRLDPEAYAMEEGAFAPATEEATMSARKLRIVLDPGHGTRVPSGARDTGTATSWGSPTVPEPVANLAIAQRMRTLLEDEGHVVWLTHERADYTETLGLGQRGQFAVDHKADVFVSIHHDGGSGRGTHGFYHNAQAVNGKRLATALAEAIHVEFGLPYSYGGPSSDWFGKSLGVLAGGGNWRLTEAAALVECCFMAGPGAEADVEIIRSPGYYDRSARALCRAIYLYADLATPDSWAPGDMSQVGDSGVLWPPSISGQPTVTRGDSGAAVRELQEALNRHGAALRVDGDFGPATYAAVVKFQREHGLDIDGIVGPLTWAKLGGAA